MNTFLFILIAAASAAVCWFLHREMIREKEVSPAGIITGRIVRCIAAAVFFAGLADAAGIIDMGAYHGAPALAGAVSAAAFVLCWINKRRPGKTAAFAVKVMLIASVFEVTLFNLPVYRFCMSDRTEMQFSADRFSAARGVKYRPDEEDILITGDSSVEFTLEGVNCEVGTVYADISFGPETKGAMMYIDAKDETQTSVYRVDVAEQKIVVGRKGSHYADLQLSGKVSDLRIRLVPINGGEISLKALAVNVQPPMEISWLRFILIVILSCFIRSAAEGALRHGCDKQKKLCSALAACITLTACITAFIVTDYKLGDRKWSEILKQTEGDQMSQELVEAFEHGSTRLLEEPSEELLSADDPYDRRLRESEGIDIKWDHVYYKGHYYSYYGTAPVILVFMPYHLLTGYFLPHEAAVLLFALIGMIGLTFAYMSMVRRFFPDTPAGIVLAGLAVIQTVSGIWFSIGRPLFYETAISAGFAFLTWAFYFMITSGALGGGSISLKRTAAASLLFGGAVLARPTLVLYCLCAALFMAVSARKCRDRRTLYLICAFAPMAVLGLFQMWYNHDRFGSPFEFGIQYSLTINDFTRTQFHWQLSLVALYNYLFNTPVFTPVYPIVSTRFQFMDVGGFFYEDYDSTMNTSGLFFLALPMFAYFFSGKALRKLPYRKDRFRAALTVGLPCVAVPLIIIASVWESGYAVRYMADFAWQSLLGAFAVIFWLYSKTDYQYTKRCIRIFMCVSLVWTLFAAGVQDINQMLRFTEDHWEHPEIAYDVEHFFAFWK